MKKLFALLASAMFALPAAAQNMGFYAGAHIGQATVDELCDGVGGAGVSCEDSDTSFKILGGMQVSPNFAVEVGWINFGEVSVTGPGGSIIAESTAFEIVGVGILPVAERFSVYGKLGLYRAETEAAVNVPAVFVGNLDESNNDLTFGFGVRFDVSRQFTVRAEWQRYADVGGGDIGEGDIDVISLGALVRF